MKKGQNVKIYARVRALMPWEPRKISLFVKGNVVRNKTEKATNEYTFQKVFNVDIENAQIFKTMVEPLIDNVLNGFNAVLIAYGQTGSGKTYSMLGKPHLGIEGLLPMMLKTLVETPSCRKLELSAVEAFGHHVARIELFDLYDPDNQNLNWTEKKGNTSLSVMDAKTVEIKNIEDAYKKIEYAHAASHFAPTGKNPESSRGHVTFMAKVFQTASDGVSEQVSYFVMVDCAGSEGESAFTPDFINAVDKTTLMARRLEAGCINTGLSQLQIIFNELRYKGKLTNMIGNGLRRVLHPYINTKTFLSVLFTFSPSVNNAKPTESTLKFAVTAGMVKVKPVKAELSINIEKLVQQLRKHIEENDKLIDEQNEKISELKLQLEKIRQEGISSGNLPETLDDEDENENADDSKQQQQKQDPSKKKNEKKGKQQKQQIHDGHTQSTLPQGLLSQLAELDAEKEEENDEPLDEMFLEAIPVKAVNEKDIEKEMEQALKRMQNVAKGADLVKAAIHVSDEKNVKQGDKTDDALKQLAETLDNANKDILEIEEEAEQKEEEDKLDEDFGKNLDELNEAELQEHCGETWVKIEDNRQEQTTLKQTQQKVVDHLLETNEWLWGALNDVLNSSIKQ